MAEIELFSEYRLAQPNSAHTVLIPVDIEGSTITVISRNDTVTITEYTKSKLEELLSNDLRKNSTDQKLIKKQDVNKDVYQQAFENLSDQLIGSDDSISKSEWDAIVESSEQGINSGKYSL